MVHQELSLCANSDRRGELLSRDAAGTRACRPAGATRIGTARAALDAVFPGNAIDVDARDRPSLDRRTADGRDRARRRDARRPADRARRADLVARSRALTAIARLRPRAGQAASPSSSSATNCTKSSTSPRVSSCCATAASPGRATCRSPRSAGSSSSWAATPPSIHHTDRSPSQRARTKSCASAASFVSRRPRHRACAVGRSSVWRASRAMGRRTCCVPSTRRRRLAGSRHAYRRRQASFPATGRRRACFRSGACSRNISIGRIASPRCARSCLRPEAERLAAAPAAERLRLDVSRFNSGILELSGGNQQKALVSRALVADTPIVLLDDPTRGVDIATKQDFYRLCSELAREGRTLVWHTTEDAELLACDRVLVFADGPDRRGADRRGDHRRGDRRRRPSRSLGASSAPTQRGQRQVRVRARAQAGPRGPVHRPRACAGGDDRGQSGGRLRFRPRPPADAGAVARAGDGGADVRRRRQRDRSRGRRLCRPRQRAQRDAGSTTSRCWARWRSLPPSSPTRCSAAFIQAARSRRSSSRSAPPSSGLGLGLFAPADAGRRRAPSG